MQAKIRKLVAIFLIVLVSIPAGFVLWRWHLVNTYSNQIFTNSADLPAYKVAIVLGASAPNFKPSPVLKQRLNAAIQLYNEKKIEKILMSGDNRFDHYNEPQVMGKYAQTAGVPKEDIVLDYAGRRTLDTCVRAYKIFSLSEAIIVTNDFHLPRSLYLCEKVGLKVAGFQPAPQKYRNSDEAWWTIRETLATGLAWFDLYLLPSRTILGDPLPILTN